MRRTSALFLLVASLLLFVIFYSFNPFVNYGMGGEIISESKEGEPITILFTGDVLLARTIETLMKKYTVSYPFTEIQSVLDDSDMVVINFESAIATEHSRTPDSSVRFSVDTSFLKSLSNAGVTHASLANNHSFDFGYTGLQNTRLELTDSGISTFGDPNTLSTSTISYIEFKENDWAIALIGIHAVVKFPESEVVERVLEEADKKSDIQIVSIHWGEEYIDAHHHGQEEFAHLLADAGADIIIGHHPHVVQDIELYNDTLIFYSLGNFIFDQYFSDDVQRGLLVQMSLADEVSFSLLPVTSIGSWSVPRLMAPRERALFLSNLAAKSSPVLNESIKNGVIIPLNRLDILE